MCEFFFRRWGQTGFVMTHGSINATCPPGVVSENALWPKYVILLPFRSIIQTPQRDWKMEAGCAGTLRIYCVEAALLFDDKRERIAASYVSRLLAPSRWPICRPSLA